MARFFDNDGVEWTYDENDRIGDPSGMGVVLLGRSTADAAPVAIKRVSLPTEATTEEQRRRAREVEIAEHLMAAASSGGETDHLVLPIGYRFIDGDLLIVMPLAEESLQAAIDAKALDLAAGIDAVRQVAVGLVQLAAIAVVHRDLKPANVLRYGPVWKITDFGLSKDLSEGLRTFTLAGWGTPQYTAPELWRGGLANAKSDLYALGVVAYQLLTGRLPFPGPNFERQHLQDTPPDLPEAPPRVARLVHRLLSKSPAERPQDARAVRESLDAYAG